LKSIEKCADIQRDIQFQNIYNLRFFSGTYFVLKPE